MAVGVSELQSPPSRLRRFGIVHRSERYYLKGRVIRTCYVLGGVWLWGLWGCGVVGLWDMSCVRRTAKWTGLDCY